MTIDDPITRRGVMAGAAATAVLAATKAPAQRRSDDLTRLSIDEASRRIAAGDLSPVELTRAYLERIERVDGQVNSYITVLAEQALAQARTLEAELARGQRRGPLHGIPLALKDNIDTAGILTTAASAVYADRIPSEDAECVRKLRDAGAVFLGKLNMHEFAYGGTSAVTHYGPVHNPWDLDYNPGGSSGGSAAAVAARLCAAALGTDTAASVRFPAACCGVAGLKATHGLASIRGIVPLSEFHDHVGPLARSVADCAHRDDRARGFRSARSGQHSRRARGLSRGDRHRRSRAAHRHSALAVLRAARSRDRRGGERARSKCSSVSRAARLATCTIAAPDTYALLDAETYAYHAPLLADRRSARSINPLTLQRIMGGASVTAQAYIEQRRRMTDRAQHDRRRVRRRRRARRADVHGACRRRSPRCSRTPRARVR